MKFFKSTIWALAALSAISFTACSDDDQYKPGNPSEGLYFEGAGNIELSLSPAEVEGVLTVYRQGITEAKTYKLDVVCEDSQLFSFNPEVTFAEGATSADFIIGYNPEQLENGVRYTMDIKFPDGTPICAYGTGEATVILMLQKSYSAPTTVGQIFGQGGVDCTWYFYTQGGTQVCGSERSGLPISVRTNTKDPKDIQFSIENWSYDFDEQYPDEVSILNIDCDMTDTYKHSGYNGAVCYPCFIAYDNGTGYGFTGTGLGEVVEMRATDLYTYLTQSPDGCANLGADPANLDRYKAASVYVPSYGVFEMYMVYYFTDGKTTMPYGLDYEYCQVSGFTDYVPSLTFAGTMANGDMSASYALIDYTISAGVEKLAMIASATDTFDDLLNQIYAESNLCTVVSGSDSQDVTGTARVQLDGSGNYTLVAATYGDGEWQQNVSLKFTTMEGLPENENIHWPVVGTAMFVDGWIMPGYNKGAINEDGLLTTEANYWNVDVRQNVENPGLYRLVSPWTSPECPIVDDNTNTQRTDLYIDATDPGCVKIEPQYSGFTDASGNDFYITNYAGTTAGSKLSQDKLLASPYNTTFDGTYLEITPSFFAKNTGVIGTAGTTNYFVTNRVPYSTLVIFDITSPLGSAKKVMGKKRNNLRFDPAFNGKIQLRNINR